MPSSKRVCFSEEKNQEIPAVEHSHVKRRKYEDEEENDNEDYIGGSSSEELTKTKKKHTLDSDEEDEADQYEKLDMDKVEGQEEATMEYEGEIKLMPFNMKDDLEEGHFDADGTFIYDKKEAMIRDAWLDNIEWDKVKDVAGKSWGKMNDNDDDDGNDDTDIPGKEDNNGTMKSIYSRLLEILKENETIAGALKKLNKEKGKNAIEERKRRWAAKKAGTSLEEDPRSKQVAELTALADSLITRGHMEAYQLGPEQIKESLTRMEQTKTVMPGPKEATVDMFAE